MRNLDHKKSQVDHKKSELDHRKEQLFRRFKWHRWFCRFFGHREMYHLQIMEEIAAELDDLCAQEEAEE